MQAKLFPQEFVVGNRLGLFLCGNFKYLLIERNAEVLFCITRGQQFDNKRILVFVNVGGCAALTGLAHRGVEKVLHY